jgi:hypothetical protein
MTTPPDRGNHLSEFELEIRTELGRAESAEPGLHAGVVAAGPAFDSPSEGYEEVEYEETERYEAGLRSLLGAIEAVEAGAVEVTTVGVQSVEWRAGQEPE